MAIRNIVKEGDSILRKVCRPVTVYDKKLWDLLDDMAETMHTADGVGLAGPQVGMMRRLCVVDTCDPEHGHGLVELINPEIIKTSGSQDGQEGCLSIPNKWGYVKRPMKVTVKCNDRFGNEVKYSAEGMEARAFCHEIDHLDGILFIDKVSRFVGDND